MTIIPVVVTSVLLAGCGAGSDDAAAKQSPAVAQTKIDGAYASADHHYLFEYIGARTQALSGQERFTTLADLLPNTKFDVGGQLRPLADKVVIGSVVAVTQGPAFKSPGSDDDNSLIQLQFDDPTAQWKALHLQVSVERGLGQDQNEDQTVDVGLAVSADADFEMLKKGLMSGRYVFFLEASPVFAYDGGPRFGIARDGALLTLIQHGKLTLPALDTEEEATLLADTPSVDALIEASKKPEKVQT